MQLNAEMCCVGTFSWGNRSDEGDSLLYHFTSANTEREQSLVEIFWSAKIKQLCVSDIQVNHSCSDLYIEHMEIKSDGGKCTESLTMRKMSNVFHLMSIIVPFSVLRKV